MWNCKVKNNVEILYRKFKEILIKPQTKLIEILNKTYSIRILSKISKKFWEILEKFWANFEVVVKFLQKLKKKFYNVCGKFS